MGQCHNNQHFEKSGLYWAHGTGGTPEEELQAEKEEYHSGRKLGCCKKYSRTSDRRDNMGENSGNLRTEYKKD